MTNQQPSRTESTGLPSVLHNRLVNVLKRSPQFNSNANLRAIFIDSRIHPWVDNLPEADTLTNRVRVTISCLYDQYGANGENALALLLQVLVDNTHSAIALHHDLSETIVEFKKHLEGKQQPTPLSLRVPEPSKSSPALDTSEKLNEPAQAITLEGTETDFVIITPLSEERDAVLAKLPAYQKLDPIPDDPYVYYQTDLPITSGKGFYRLIVMPLVGMGRVKAATATDAAIRRWNPRYIVLVGIAGGVAAKGVRPGDVLIADKIVDYALQKQTTEGSDIRWEVYNVSTSLLAAAQNFRDDNWLPLMQTKRPKRGKPKCHIGPIASGDVVINFIDILNKYRETWSKLVGVEMEAGGAALSAFLAEKQTLFFMIRGVSDLADGTKDKPAVKKWRAYTCDVAAAYAIGLIKSGPVTLTHLPETVPFSADESQMGNETSDQLQYSASGQPFAEPPKQPEPSPFPKMLHRWRIIVVSLSDVQAEKEQLKEVIGQFNELASIRGVHIELFCEDDMIPSMGDPHQSRLEQYRIEETDLVILILWHRFAPWIEQAFDLTHRLFEENGHPQVSTYRCMRSVDPDQIISDQYAALEAFLKRYPGLTQGYKSIEEFKGRVPRDLEYLLSKITNH